MYEFVLKCAVVRSDTMNVNPSISLFQGGSKTVKYGIGILNYARSYLTTLASNYRAYMQYRACNKHSVQQLQQQGVSG